MKLKIIFENEQVLVVDKPAGLVVNKSETAKEETLQDQLSKYFHLQDLGVGDRAGIVHRLDRQTSGLLVIAKDQKTFDFLQKQFKGREVKKEYLALVHGSIKQDKGSIAGDISRIGKFGKFGVVYGGRPSETGYEVIKEYEISEIMLKNLLSKGTFTKARINYLEKHASNYSFVKLMPKTGRTHQIRVHLKSIGNPVVSDKLYAPAKLLKFDLMWCPRLFLHSSSLEFKVLGFSKPLKFESQLPQDIKSALTLLAVNN